MGIKRLHLSKEISHYISKHLLRISDFCHKSRKNFYWAIAFLLSLVIFTSTLFDINLLGSEEATFDSIIKMRLSSPVPSSDIVILDIDEKSLAQLAPSLGRWPWKREVLGEALSEIEASGARSILFNILITDPDKGNEQSDAILSSVAADSKITSFPLVRLPFANDQKSSFHVSKLPGVDLKEGDPTIAIIIPGLPGMQRNLGFSNLDNDEDGILRKYSLVRSEGNWSMPNIVGRTLDLAKISPNLDKFDSNYINWRNKKGAYKRVSFGDFYASLSSPSNSFDKEVLKNKFIIVGVSAAGIANLKPTAASPLMDDNEILATALDDAINGSNLKPMPKWAMSGFAILFILFLAYMFSAAKASEELDIIFIIIELGSVALMFLMMSYSTYFIDMSSLATYGLIFFTVSKVHQNLAERVVKGAPEHLHELAGKKPKLLGIMTFTEHDNLYKALKKSFKVLEENFGSKNVFICFDIFGKDTILSHLNEYGCLVIISKESNEQKFSNAINTFFRSIKINKNQFSTFKISQNIENNSDLISKFISQKILSNISSIE